MASSGLNVSITDDSRSSGAGQRKSGLSKVFNIEQLFQGGIFYHHRKLPILFGKRVEGRFGVLPNFFRLAPETPEITKSVRQVVTAGV